VVLAAGPALVAALGFAAVSWVVVGHPFEQLSSQYGNSALLAAAGGGSSDVPVLAQQAALEPYIWWLVGSAVVVAVVRRRWWQLAFLPVLGGSLAFSVAAALAGSTFGWLRFQVYVVPMAVLSAAVLLAPSGFAAGGRLAKWSMAIGCAVTTVAVSAAVVLAPWPSTTAALRDPALSPEDAPLAGAVLSRLTGARAGPSSLGGFRTDRAVALRIDRLGLPDGSVLVDSAVGFQVVLASQRSRQFIITSDRDFQRMLADPRTAGVRYLLVSTQRGVDALTVVHPTLYDTGAGFGTLVDEFHNPVLRGRDWRLYRVEAPRARTGAPGVR
jgi:hypothetical protein